MTGPQKHELNNLKHLYKTVGLDKSQLARKDRLECLHKSEVASLATQLAHGLARHSTRIAGEPA